MTRPCRRSGTTDSRRLVADTRKAPSRLPRRHGSGSRRHGEHKRRGSAHCAGVATPEEQETSDERTTPRADKQPAAGGSSSNRLVTMIASGRSPRHGDLIDYVRHHEVYRQHDGDEGNQRDSECSSSHRSSSGRRAKVRQTRAHLGKRC